MSNTPTTAVTDTTATGGTGRRAFKLSEGLLLATGPTLAYLLAFYYEKGYISGYGMPPQFISINVITIFIYGAIVLGAALSLFPITNFIAMVTLAIFHKPVPAVLRRTVVTLTGAATYVVVHILLFGFSQWQYWLHLLILFVILTIVILGLPLVTQRDKTTYLRKFEAQLATERHTRDILSLLPAESPSSRTIILAILLFILSLFTAQSAGKAAALRQTRYYVTNTTPEMVVLRIYGENMIVAPFDREIREVQRSFSVLKVAADPKLVLTLEEVGPLAPSEP